jgi:hypothetical protein
MPYTSGQSCSVYEMKLQVTKCYPGMLSDCYPHRNQSAFDVCIFIFLDDSYVDNVRHDRYLENGGEGAIVKPWVWIILIAASPMCFSVLFQLYIFFSVNILAFFSISRSSHIITLDWYTSTRGGYCDVTGFRPFFTD